MTVIVALGAPGAPQVGVVAGRGVGGAVRRNRAKRRLRHAMAAAPLVSSTAYIVIAGRRVPDVGYPTLAGWLAGAMGRTGGDDRGRMDREEETK